VPRVMGRCIRWASEQMDGEIIERIIQDDHLHLILMVPPLEPTSNCAGTAKRS
jgi:REP element-mobilizing transposase RayT